MSHCFDLRIDSRHRDLAVRARRRARVAHAGAPPANRLCSRCRPAPDSVRQGSARKDLVVEFGAELADCTPAPSLFATMPSLDGGLENTPLIAHLLMQRDVAGFDPRHDAGPRHADQIGRLLRAEHGVRVPRRCCAAVSAGAADRWTAQQSGEFALDQSCGPRRELDMPPHDLDERVDLDAHRQGGRRRGLACFGGSAGGFHPAKFSRSW